MNKTPTHEVFYVAPADISDGQIRISGDEFRHAVRVKRHRVGDIITVVDGEGSAYRAQLTSITRSEAISEILDKAVEAGEPGYALTIGIGIPKNPSRLEVFLEKATELGVARIVPLVTDRTERMRLNEVRARRILISATKQSGRSRLPDLQTATRLPEILENDGHELRLILHEEERETGLFDLAEEIQRSEQITILIGPEGGFDPDELALAKSGGWRTASLGPHRLRTETAGIVAAAAVSLIKSSSEAKS